MVAAVQLSCGRLTRTFRSHGLTVLRGAVPALGVAVHVVQLDKLGPSRLLLRIRWSRFAKCGVVAFFLHHQQCSHQDQAVRAAYAAGTAALARRGVQYKAWAGVGW